MLKEIAVGKEDAGQRLDRYLQKNFPGLPSALMHKYIRKKRIKCNRKRCQAGLRLKEGDIIQLYIADDITGASETDKSLYMSCQPKFSVVYEDENLLLADKPAGMLAESEDGEKHNTLLFQARAYLYQKNEWNPESENSFAPVLCNRIDRNTGGLVLIAKNAEARRILDDKIKNHEITKKYLCLAFGKIQPASGRLEYFLLKKEKQKLVEVYHHPVPGGRTAVTLYRVLKTRGDLSLVEVRLETGRTHQIRASFAAAGFPLLGDGKYGSWELNHQYGETKQALYSCSVRFDFPGYAGILEYLRGREFQVRQIPFVEKYFPE